MAVFRCDAFGMKLDAMHGMRFVHHALYDAVAACRGHFEIGRHTVRRDSQRVIARGLEIIVKAAKDAFAGVMNARNLAMHRFRRAHDPAAIHLADRLVTEAHAKDRHAAVCGLDEVETDPGFVGRAGTGRQHDGLRLQRQRTGGGQFVIALYDDVGPQLSQIMEEVVGETVIIIDQKEQNAPVTYFAAPGWLLARNAGGSEGLLRRRIWRDDNGPTTALEPHNGRCLPRPWVSHALREGWRCARSSPAAPGLKAQSRCAWRAHRQPSRRACETQGRGRHRPLCGSKAVVGPLSVSYTH